MKVSDTIMTGNIVHRIISSKDFIKDCGKGELFVLSYRDNQGNRVPSRTLFLDYDKPSFENNCKYFFQQFTVNNEVAPIDNGLHLRNPDWFTHIVKIE